MRQHFDQMFRRASGHEEQKSGGGAVNNMLMTHQQVSSGPSGGKDGRGYVRKLNLKRRLFVAKKTSVDVHDATGPDSGRPYDARHNQGSALSGGASALSTRPAARPVI